MTDRSHARTQAARPRSRGRGIAAALLAGTALFGALAVPQATAYVPPTALPASGFADLVEQVSPAVVTITASGGGERREVADLPPGFEEFLRRFGPPEYQFRRGPQGPQREQARSLGSGFVFDPAGFIVTNRHVVEDADEVTVTFQDGKDLKATIVGTDDKTDLAVLKVDAPKPLPSLPFADSDKVRVGDVVVAVGNPFGLGGTVTAGIVSARSRNVGNGPFDDYIQLDAAINRGNSGGPTFNAKGEVVGINTLIFSPNGGSVGIGFAIPANLAKPIVEQLKTTGRIDRGWLGVSLQAVNQEIADSLGLKEAAGALIASVQPDSPAAGAGLKPGDVVVGAASKPVKETRDLARAVAGVTPGTEVGLTVWRDGKETRVPVKVGESPDARRSAPALAQAGPQAGQAEAAAGLKLARLDDTWRRRLDLDPGISGVVVVDVAEEVENVRPGDVILTVNNEPVAAPADVSRQVEAAEKAGRKNALLQLRRGSNTAFVALPVRKA
ncbi:Do family serine endopeptidase [Aerophototrophica crusticola]|uniref:Probable periplasmic serine endoprotease DegP-like n=1 Tax=Aerophototrophica crusticola TaxID=1709002 RepID=A0A858R3D5_9PROT|nr:Do family serine endopeptidase [Rhodospirillaceae bacterium B3]